MNHFSIYSVIKSCLLVMCARLGENDPDDELYNGRCAASSTYADNACRPATAAAASVVIATSDVTDYHDDDDGRTVLTSRAPAGVMATDCLCRYDDNERAEGDCVLSARVGSSWRPSSKLRASLPQYQTHHHLVRPS